MVRLQPPSNVDNRRSLSERVSGFFDRAFEWDALIQLFGVVAGLGCLGYLFSAWLQEFLLRSSYISAIILAMAGLVLAGLSLARIPVALVILLGGAIVSVIAFLGGNLHLLLP